MTKYETLTENFSAPLDPAKWTVYEGSTVPVPSSGVLRLSDEEILSIESYTLKDSYLYFKIVPSYDFVLDGSASPHSYWMMQILNTTPGGDDDIQVGTNLVNSYSKLDFSLYHRDSPYQEEYGQPLPGVSGEEYRTWVNTYGVDYDPIAHKWLRIRQDTDGYVYLDAAPDGKTWNQVYKSYRPSQVDSATVYFYSDAPGFIALDNLNIPESAPQPVVRLSKINLSPVQTPQIVGGYEEIYTPNWQWAVGYWKGDNVQPIGTVQPEYELRNISNRRLTIKLSEPDEASYTMLGEDPAAINTYDLKSDLWVWRDGQRMGRFRHISSQDSINETDYTINWNCVSYAGLLARRIIDSESIVKVSEAVSLPILPFYSATPEDTLWHLLRYAQGYRGAPPGLSTVYEPKATLPGMDLGITQGMWPDLALETQAYQYFSEGDAILDAVHTVIRNARPSGFDFWIDWDLKANIMQERGINNGSTLDYGQRVSSISRSFSHEAYANYLRQSGSFEGVAVRLSSIPQDEGGWMTALGMPSVINTDDPATLQLSLLNSIAQSNFEKLSRSLPGIDNDPGTGNFSYSVTLAPGVWRGRGHIWVGDTVRLVVKRGRLDINHEMRVVQIEIDIDQNNRETVNMTLNWPNNPKDNLRNFAASVKYLNKR